MIYLCGMTSSEYQNIKELTEPVWKVFDGLIFTVDDKASTDGTLELLEERKGKGEILHRKFTNDHDLSMNVWLREGPLKRSDWFVFRDSMERFSPEFAAKLPDMLLNWELQGVRTIYNYGKIFAAKWNDSMVFQSSPHFGLIGAQGKSIDLKEMHDESKHEWTWRIRDGEEGGRPIDNKINHEARYYWVYGRSNHLLLGNEANYDAFLRLEAIRLYTRDQAVAGGYELNMDGLEAFMRTQEDNAKNWINGTYVLRNFYRYHILGDKFEDIEREQDTWRLV